MAYDEGLAHRIREMLAERTDIVEKKMFGGIAFLLSGNMSVGVVKSDMVVRVGADREAEALALDHARPMDFTGRKMKGWIFVAPEGYESDSDLDHWVTMGLTFASSLPEK